MADVDLRALEKKDGEVLKAEDWNAMIQGIGIVRGLRDRAAALEARADRLDTALRTLLDQEKAAIEAERKKTCDTIFHRRFRELSQSAVKSPRIPLTPLSRYLQEFL
jgi:hypothetical protein